MLTLCRVAAVSSRASWPADRSSTTGTSSPLVSRASVICEPMNPAPPVTSTRMVVDPSTGQDDGHRVGDGTAPALGPAGPGCQSQEDQGWRLAGVGRVGEHPPGLPEPEPEGLDRMV